MNNRKFIIVAIYILFFCGKSFGQNYFDAASKEYFSGDLNKSIELFSKSINANQHPANSFMLRGAAKSFLGKFDEALNDLNHSFLLDSTNAKIYYYYGKFYILKKEFYEALKYIFILF